MASIISAGTTSGTALNLSGDTSGNLAFTTSAGTYTQTMPNVTGNVVLDSATQTLTNKTIQGGAITSMTAQTTNGASTYTFTGIPSWTKRITLMFVNVTAGTSANWAVQVGSGSLQTSGYVATYGYVAAGNIASADSLTSGFPMGCPSSVVGNGAIVLSYVGSNTWVCHGTVGMKSNVAITVSGSVVVTGTLDRIALYNSGTTYTGGSINVLYE